MREIKRLAWRLHPKLAEAKEVAELLEAEALAFDDVDAHVMVLEHNAAISTAEEKTLLRLEQEFGLLGGRHKDVRDRRALLLARLRGHGTTTPAFIVRLAKAFENGDVVVEENADAPYVVGIRFVSLYGKPPNLEDFMTTLAELLPAHLKLEPRFTYMTWQEFDDYNKTWQGWEDIHATWDSFEVYKEN